MLDIGWSEMFVILVVALIVIGPKDLPRVARTLGKWVGKARQLAREFQTSIEDMAREAELDDVKKEIERAGRTDLRKTVENAIDPRGELKDAFDVGKMGKSKAKSAAPKPATPAPPSAGSELSGPPPAPVGEPAQAAAGENDREREQVVAGSP